MSEVTEAVKAMLDERAVEGMVSYGVPIERAERTLPEWVKETQEELLDAVVYLEMIKRRLSDAGLV